MWTAEKIIEKIRRDFPVSPAPDYDKIGGEAIYFFAGKKWTDLSGDVYLEHGKHYGDWDSYLP